MIPTAHYTPLFTAEEFEEYSDSIEHEIKFVKVSWEQENAVWIIDPLQIKGHEVHYTWPQSGQLLPYNVVVRNDQELTAPRPLFADSRSPRVTMV